MAVQEGRERAKRLARVIASDLIAYHESEIDEGIRNDDLFERLAMPIEDGRRHFESSVSQEILSEGLFERALVDALVGARGHVDSPIW